MPFGKRFSGYACILLGDRGANSGNPSLQDLRSWPVAGFEAIRVYYIPDQDCIRVMRILHGKRDVMRILKRERAL
jgi:plasmid stabilization system protein ParE